MFFRKKKEKATKKIDKLVTGFIIGWAVASVIWLSQTKKWKEITAQAKEKSKWVFAKANNIAWKWIIKILNVLKKK